MTKRRPIGHMHHCAVCRHYWRCDQVRCPITVAARVNGNGTRCPLCQGLELACRVASVRGVPLYRVTTRLRRIWKTV